MTLSHLFQHGPVVLTFYRGAWCPYCRLTLLAYQQAWPHIRDVGAALVAISPQTPEHSRVLVETEALTFTVLSDVGNAVARQFWLVYTVDEAVRAAHHHLGADLPAFNGDESWELPIPGTFIVDQAGTVLLAFVDPDFTHRLDPSAIIARLFARLDASAIEKTQLLTRTQQVATLQERQRIARDLHDSVTQTLFGLQAVAQAALDFWETQPAQAHAAVETILHLARAASEEVFTPQPAAIPELSPASRSAIEDRLAARGIAFLPNHKASAVAPGEVVFADERRPFDLLLGVPPHRCPEVVARSGLTEGGAWVWVDPRTLETRFPGVYAVGDVTEILMANGSPLPKSGLFAEAEGRVVAERIAAAFDGRPAAAAFDGVGYCFIEVSTEEAMLLRGQYLADPLQVEVTEPSRQSEEEKRAFEAERLKQWFGY